MLELQNIVGVWTRERTPNLQVIMYPDSGVFQFATTKLSEAETLDLIRALIDSHGDLVRARNGIGKLGQK